MIAGTRQTVTLIAVVLIFLSSDVDAWRRFFRGRRHDGMLGRPRTPANITLPPDEWFNQQLDHFNPTDFRTWNQRYFTNDTFYVRGGPVFLLIGGEGTASPEWMVTGQWINYAQRYNALCFQLEHRYYGASHPVRDLGVKNMVYLSSQQALADLAYFIQGMTDKYDLPPETKWIAFGGSYPGSLAAWLRDKYGHLVHGAVSASGPLLAKADFREYYRVVEDDLVLSNGSCVTAIKDATRQLKMLLKHSFGQETVNKMFKLCDPIDVLENKDVSNLFESLAGNFAEIAQYNKDNRHFEGSRSDITLDLICRVMANESLGTPVHRYAAVNTILLQANDEQCLDYKYDKMINELGQTDWQCKGSEGGGRQWMYQTCTEFGFYQTSNLTAEVFGDEFRLDFFIQQCRDIFNNRYDRAQVMRGIKRTNIMYGEFHVKASRVVYVHGSVDPWHALGITRTLQKESPAIYIRGTAHCADMYPSAESDSPQLKAARRMISDLIGQWLEEE